MDISNIVYGIIAIVVAVIIVLMVRYQGGANRDGADSDRRGALSR